MILVLHGCDLCLGASLYFEPANFAVLIALQHASPRQQGLHLRGNGSVTLRQKELQNPVFGFCGINPIEVKEEMEPQTTVENLLRDLYRAPVRIRRDAILAAERALENKTTALLATQADAGRLLSCSRFTIRRMVQDGQLHPVTIRGCRRYRVEELEKMAAGEVAAS